jgi:hypothetical protein
MGTGDASPSRQWDGEPFAVIAYFAFRLACVFRDGAAVNPRPEALAKADRVAE